MSPDLISTEVGNGGEGSVEDGSHGANGMLLICSVPEPKTWLETLLEDDIEL